MASESPTYSTFVPRSRTEGQVECIDHFITLDVVCETCQTLVCVQCMTQTHRGHTFVNLQDIIPEKRREIQSFIENPNSSDLTPMKEDIASAYIDLAKCESEFDYIGSEVEKQGVLLKDRVDFITASTLSVYQQLKEENVTDITSYIADLKQRCKDVDDRVQICQDVMKTGSNIQIFDALRSIRSLKPLPVCYALRNASFKPNKDENDFLEQAFGVVKTNQAQCKKEPDDNTYRQTISSPGKATMSESHVYDYATFDFGASGLYQSISSHTDAQALVQKPTYTLLDETAVLSKFRTPQEITAICPSVDGMAWVKFRSKAKLLDRLGNVHQEARYKVQITDMDVSPTTENLWICSKDDSSVIELVSGRHAIRFHTSLPPSCMCFSSNNCIIIGMVKQITKFSTTGTNMQNLGPDISQDPLVCSPIRISECPVTNNIAVVDLNLTSHGGGGTPRIVVLNKNFLELSNFIADDVPNTSVGKNKFDPSDVRYDSVGNIVVADWNSRCIHLITGSCKYIRVIHTDTAFTVAIGVTSGDAVWAVFGDSPYKVKLLQYSCK